MRRTFYFVLKNDGVVFKNDSSETGAPLSNCRECRITSYRDGRVLSASVSSFIRRATAV